jgi:hypothetical protein
VADSAKGSAKYLRGRSLTGTFAGIRPIDVPLFVFAQFAGVLAATLLFRWLVPGLPGIAEEILVHAESAGR